MPYPRVLLRGSSDSLLRWLFGLCSQLLGVPLHQLVSRVAVTGKDLRQRQHTLVSIENDLSTALTPVGLSGVHIHHNARLTGGARYLDNLLIRPLDRSDYVTPGRQSGIANGKGLRHLEIELIGNLSAASEHSYGQYAQCYDDEFSKTYLHGFSLVNGGPKEGQDIARRKEGLLSKITVPQKYSRRRGHTSPNILLPWFQVGGTGTLRLVNAIAGNVLVTFGLAALSGVRKVFRLKAIAKFRAGRDRRISLAQDLLF